MSKKRNFLARPARKQCRIMLPVYHKGKRCGAIREYADGLMMFLLRGRMPEKYNTQRVEHGGRGGTAIPFRVIEFADADTGFGDDVGATGQAERSD